MAGLIALGAAVWTHARPDHVGAGSASAEQRRTESARGADQAGAVAAGRALAFGAYGGMSYTHPSAVRIVDPGRTDLGVKDFGWIGMPFKSPVYYGVRALRWSSPDAAIGAMLDFTHAKAIARAEDVATFSGMRDGRPVAPKARIGDVFKHLEFSHGHNIVTLNGLIRMSGLLLRVRPYIGVGVGVSLPHTEVGFRAERERTYEYQFAGLAGQLVAGLEIPLGRGSVFVEYKLTYTPYEVPLSHEPSGRLLMTDLWRQLTAWASGATPPGGRLATTLVTQHAIAGILAVTSPRIARP